MAQASWKSCLALVALIAVSVAGAAVAKPRHHPYNLTTTPGSGSVVHGFLRTVTIAIKYIAPVEHVLLDGRVINRISVHQWQTRVRVLPGRNEYHLRIVRRDLVQVKQVYVLYGFVRNDFVRDPARDSGLPSCTVCTWEDPVGDARDGGDIGAVHVVRGAVSPSDVTVTATVAIDKSYPCFYFVAGRIRGWIGCHGPMIVDLQRRPLGTVQVSKVVGEGLTAWIFRFHSRPLGNPAAIYLRAFVPRAGGGYADLAPNALKRVPGLMYKVQLRLPR